MLQGTKKYLPQLRDNKVNNALSKYYLQKLTKTHNALEVEAIIYMLSLINWSTANGNSNDL